MKHDLKLSSCILLVTMAALVLLPGLVLAATISGTSSSITINSAPFGVETVKIALPGGEVISSEELTLFAKDVFPDGDYQYQLIGVLPKRVEEAQVDTGLKNGRGNVAPKVPVGVVESGDFRIVGGVVVDTRTLVEN